MVTLVRSSTNNGLYGFWDKENNQVLHWNQCRQKDTDGFVWCSDAWAESYTVMIGVGVDEYDAERKIKLPMKKRILAFLKKSLDRTSNKIPIVLDCDFCVESERDYTDVEIGDACQVPECEWSAINFRTESSNESFAFVFQENTTPWFTGDGHDFPSRYWARIDSYDENELDEWEIVTDKDELARFYELTFGKIEKELEEDIRKTEEKKKKDASAFEDAIGKLTTADNSVKNKVVEYAKKNKLNGKKLDGFVEFLNSVLT